MKKIVPKKKLQLRRATIAKLAGPALRDVVGGFTGIDNGAGIDSIVLPNGTIERCQMPITEGG